MAAGDWVGNDWETLTERWIMVMMYTYMKPNGDMEDVMISAEVIRLMLEGKKIHAIKAVRADAPSYLDTESGEYRSTMGLVEAKKCIEYWENEIWPGDKECCPHCKGRGEINKQSQKSPMYIAPREV
jgi:hypothetical protein